MPRPRSLRNRLAFLFFGVTALALAVVIFVFLPQLETKIEDQKLGDLRDTATREAPKLRTLMGKPVTARKVDDAVRNISDRTSARVTLLGIQQSTRDRAPRFYVISDSNQSSAIAPNWGLATRALAQPRASTPAAGITDHQGEVALPLYYAGAPGWIAVFSRDFGDASQAVRLVRDRLLVASAGALPVAPVGGWRAASRSARRVTRLERAARRVAAGHK